MTYQKRRSLPWRFPTKKPTRASTPTLRPGSGSRSLKGGNRIHLFSSIAKSDARAVAIGGGARYGQGYENKRFSHYSPPCFGCCSSPRTRSRCLSHPTRKRQSHRVRSSLVTAVLIRLPVRQLNQSEQSQE